jgi:hypothetical protein
MSQPNKIFFVKWPPRFNYSTLKCNNMTPNALKMHIREVWFKHFENFNPSHFGFNYSIQIRYFWPWKFPNQNKKITKIKKCLPTYPTYLPYLPYLPTLPLRESGTRTTPFFWFGLSAHSCPKYNNPVRPNGDGTKNEITAVLGNAQNISRLE